MTPELYPWCFEGPLALLVVYALPLATAGRSAWRHRARARNARIRARAARDAANAEAATLDVGDTIVHGKVAYAESKDRALSVTVEQEGSEAESSGSWTVTWTERRRRVEPEPFYVVHASGDRVRVEPNAKTQLVTMLSPTSRRKGTWRTRVATIFSAEEVWVTGVLTRDRDPERPAGYRDLHGWVMRPTSVSTEQPEARLLREAKRARRWSIVFTLLFVGMMASHTLYHALVLSGRPTTAHVTKKTTEPNGDSDDEYDLHVRLDAPTPFDDTWRVTPSAFNAVKEGDTFPAIATSLLSTSDPGPRPLAFAFATNITLAIWFVLVAIAYFTGGRRSWYEGELVVDSVSGRLED